MENKLKEILEHIGLKDCAAKNAVKRTIEWMDEADKDITISVDNHLIKARKSGDIVKFHVSECTSVAGISVVQPTHKTWQFDI